MKIEIELEEIEKLRKEVSDLKAQNERQRKELYEFNQNNLIEKAVKLSQELTDKCIKKIFEGLGFTYSSIDHKCRFRIRDDDGKYWWDSDKTEIEIRAEVSTNFKNAFLTIGYKSSEDQVRVEELKLPD